MTDVTDADREKAMQIMAWDPLTYEGLAEAVERGGDADDRDSLEMVDAIAAALAEERAKARAPFLALAEEWAGRQQVVEDLSGDKKRAGHWVRGDVAAERIRRAAEETE